MNARDMTGKNKNNGLYHYIRSKSAEHIANDRESPLNLSGKNWFKRNGEI